MQCEITSSIDIATSATEVWRVLTDLSRFHEWNPFIRQARGPLTVGSIVRVRVAPRSGVRLAFRARVLARDDERELRWRGHFLHTALFDGEHAFTIEPIDAAHVRFVQREIFRGALLPLVVRVLEPETRRGFARMNAALKARAEHA